MDHWTIAEWQKMIYKNKKRYLNRKNVVWNLHKLKKQIMTSINNMEWTLE